MKVQQLSWSMRFPNLRICVNGRGERPVQSGVSAAQAQPIDKDLRKRLARPPKGFTIKEQLPKGVYDVVGLKQFPNVMSKS